MSSHHRGEFSVSDARALDILTAVVETSGIRGEGALGEIP